MQGRKGRRGLVRASDVGPGDRNRAGWRPCRAGRSRTGRAEPRRVGQPGPRAGAETAGDHAESPAESILWRAAARTAGRMVSGRQYARSWGTDGCLSRESVVLRLQECYMTRGAMVKKSTGSCLLGWACDPIRSGSTARRLCGKPPRLAAITRPACRGFAESATCRSFNAGLS